MTAQSIGGITVTGLYALALLSMVFVLLTDDREPSIVMSWLFVLGLAPGFGFVAYVLLGRNFRREARSGGREVQTIREAMAGITDVQKAAAPVLTALLEARPDGPAARVARVAQREGNASVVGADTLEVFYSGKDKFPRLLADLAEAKHTIRLMYLIWERDELTAKVTEILLDRLAHGVEVVILYDWLTSLRYRKSELRRLNRAGALVQPCYRRLLRINYRNHMKVAVVDGEVAYTGGMNMGQEYADGGSRFASWRDTHLRMTGPVVAPLQALTASVWRLNGRTEDLTEDRFMPSTPDAQPGAIPVQIVHSSVWTPAPVNRDVFITVLGAATQSVWIESPYFIPDEPLLAAMTTAATSGLDIRLMMAGVYDKAVPWWVAQTYFRPLLEAGARIFQYEAGFLHSKMVTLDEDLTIIGTCNWDIRSLILHDEVSTVIHSTAVTQRTREQFLLDQESCREVTLTTLEGTSRLAKVRNQGLRLTARLL
jgi:cardiolipin synthase A/B